MATNYRKIYENYHGVEIPKGMHIHHIDGNRENNNPLNLQMVTPEEHAKIHCERGDSWYNSSLDKWISGASEAGRKGAKSGNSKRLGEKRGPRPQEVKDKIRASQLGVPKHTEESKKKISWKNKTHTEQTRNKMSISAKLRWERLKGEVKCQ